MSFTITDLPVDKNGIIYTKFQTKGFSFTISKLPIGNFIIFMEEVEKNFNSSTVNPFYFLHIDKDTLIVDFNLVQGGANISYEVTHGKYGNEMKFIDSVKITNQQLKFALKHYIQQDYINEQIKLDIARKKEGF